MLRQISQMVAVERAALPGPPGQLPPDESLAPTIYGVIVPFMTIASGFYVARMYTRIQVLKSVWWDDWIISIAMITALAGGIVIVVLPQYDFGRHFYYSTLGNAVKSTRLGFVAQNLYFFDVTLIKVAMAFQLLRIKQDRRWVFGLSALVMFLVVTGICGIITNFIQCAPIQGNWNPFVPNLRCWPPSSKKTVFNIFSAVFIATDLIFAALPISFIHSIRRRWREKTVLLILMGLGLLATAASIIKMIYLINFKNPQDANWEIVYPSLWAKIEEYVGIIASCVPCLRSLIQRILQQFGLAMSKQPNSYSKGVSKSMDKAIDQRLQDIRLPAAANQHESEIELIEPSREGL